MSRDATFREWTEARAALRSLGHGPRHDQAVAEWKCDILEAVDRAAAACTAYRNDVETMTEAKRDP